MIAAAAIVATILTPPTADEICVDVVEVNTVAGKFTQVLLRRYMRLPNPSHYVADWRILQRDTRVECRRHGNAYHVLFTDAGGIRYSLETRSFAETQTCRDIEVDERKVLPETQREKYLP